jgi:threonine/homoserine/homoserine lactone efflux protein
MNTLFAGFGIALLVSIPPGANTALCVTLARGGARKAIPIILGAAATDAIYAILAAVGILAVNTISVDATHWLAAAFCVLAAALLWLPRLQDVSGRTAIGLAVLNPGTASLWLGLSAFAVAHPKGLSLGLWVLGVAAGTATWFSGVAFASARLQRVLLPTQQLLLQRSFAIALVAGGVMFVS